MQNFINLKKSLNKIYINLLFLKLKTNIQENDTESNLS